MENMVIIPTFGIKENDLAVRQLETIFAGNSSLASDGLRMKLIAKFELIGSD